MARFAPFAGIRYAAGQDLAALSAPPYDVIDGPQRAALAAGHRHNVVHVDLPVADGDGTGDAYDAAGATFATWQRDGVLVTDGEPALYPYRMTFTDETGLLRRTLGVIGALGVTGVDGEGVLPHEHTTPKAAGDRLRLLRATEANLSAIWGLSLTGGLTDALEVDRAEPVAACTDADGVGHELWRVSEPDKIKRIVEAVQASPVVLADGHHRYHTCRTHAEEPGAPPGAGATMCFVVELVERELTVQPIHRLISGLNPDAARPVDIAAALRPWFTAGASEPVPGPEMVARMIGDGVLGLLTGDGFQVLHPDVSALTEAAGTTLDSAWFAVAEAGLGEHQVRFQHGVERAAGAVADGSAQAAVLLRPVSVDQIRATADAGGLMPPKSTFFAPKPATGMVFRSLRGTDG